MSDLVFTMAIAVAGLWQGPPPPRTLPPPGVMATASATQPVSPVALMTWVTRYGGDEVHALDLIVLWRGDPGWFLQGTSRSIRTGGSADAFWATIRYAGRELQLGLDSARRLADVQGIQVELGHANVILVDQVDTADGPRVVGTLRIDPDVPHSADGHPRVESVLRRSPAVIAFLRCDVVMPDGRRQALFDRLCAQVLGGSPR